MATGRGVNQGKTEFVEEQFRRDSSANHESINQAWTESDHEGSISESLVNKIRARLKVTGKRGRNGAAAAGKRSGLTGRGRPGRPKGSRAERAGSAGEGQTAAAGAGDREQRLDRVEDSIDDLIVELKGVGGMDEALEALRKARRVVVRSQDA